VTVVYVFEIEGMKIAGYLSHIGSALAGSDVIDANWLTGADKSIMFGSAGSLDSNTTDGKFVIPTAAYREEGLSYHYAAPTDYIEIKNAKAVKAIFDELNLYDFLATGDVLDQAVYDVSGLADANHNMDKLYIAIEIAKRI
jgi:uridine phosphorylase